MVNGTLLVVGFFVVATRLLIGAAPSPAPFFWVGDTADSSTSSSSSEEDEPHVEKIYVYINYSNPGLQIPFGATAGAGSTANSLPALTLPIMVQFTAGSGSLPAAAVAASGVIATDTGASGTAVTGEVVSEPSP